MLSNVLSGRLIDRIGTRKVLNVMLAMVLLDFVLVHATASHLWTAIAAVFWWGAFGWGTVVPLQHRLVGIAPPIAPLLLGLNSSAIYLGTTVAGLIGAAGIQMVGAQSLGYIAAGFVAAALVVAELSARKIAAVHRNNASASSAAASVAVASERS
jgi:predicted MFS family arabinose efflux permease